MSYMEDKSKIIRLSMARIRDVEFPSSYDKFYEDAMITQFKRAIAQLKASDIINIREDDGIIYYDIDCVIKKY